MKDAFVAGWVKTSLARIAATLGYEPAQPAPPDAGQLLGNHLRKLFSHLQINCVLDVGANQGQYGRFLRQTGYKGWIISFEPAPADFQVLAEHAAADSRWYAHRLALGEENGTRPMHLTDADSLFNSFLAPTAFLRNFGIQSDARLEVPVRRLDAILGDVTAPVPHPRIYIKSDTQGYDLQVIEGARDVLSSILALQVEVAFQRLYEGMTPFTDAFTTLTNKGFDVSGFFPISIDDELRLVEADCVMVYCDAVEPLGNLHPADWWPEPD